MDLAKIVKDLFGSEENLINNKNSILLGISKSKEDKKYIIEILEDGP